MGKKERYRNHLPICNELGNKGGRTWWTGTYSSDSIAGEMYLSISVFWEETYTYKKAPRIWSRTKQRERLMRCIIYSHQWLRTTLAFVVMGAFLYTYTSVGLSALLVSTTWAMPEPLLRGTSDRTGSTFFVYTQKEYKHSHTDARWLQIISIMGISNKKTTQIYAKVTSTKLDHDIAVFESRIKGHLPVMGGMAWKEL